MPDHSSRRNRLAEEVGGPILLLGNGIRDRNLPGYGVPFRQDSTFLYFVGSAQPDCAALLHEGVFTFFAPQVGPDDALWHGPSPSLEALGQHLGADRVRPFDDLEQTIRSLVTRGQTPHALTVADAAKNHELSTWLGVDWQFGRDPGSEELIRAVIGQRRTKDHEELAELRRAAQASGDAHRAAIAATHPGVSEASLTALFEAVLAMHGCTPGYDTILSQDGEILHNHRHHNMLERGRLVLCDGGGEVASGYGADITRTWPVSGRFSTKQNAAYKAVLAAQAAAIAMCEVGVRYRHVHDRAAQVLAEFLVDEGLLRGDPTELAALGAHALFFPHGVGHHLGLDVHDMENFGDRPSYPMGQPRPAGFGTRYLRLDLPLEAGWVVTIEPGFYVIDAIFDDPDLTEPFEPFLDRAVLDTWRGFGGIRIEDDVHITTDGPEVLTAATPKQPGAIASLVGTRPPPLELLTGF